MRVILDNGHGGSINGEYQTEGKRSPGWYLGTLYEGVFNRWIVNRVVELLGANEIPFYHISPELWDVSLDARCNRANLIYERDPDTYLLSIHANAGGGTGIEGFTSTGNTMSDIIADRFLYDLQVRFPDTIMRYDYTDGDKDKEANFRILTKTKCPALLLELGFMDHPDDYKKLWNAQWRDEISRCLFSTIVNLK